MKGRPILRRGLAGILLSVPLIVGLELAVSVTGLAPPGPAPSPFGRAFDVSATPMPPDPVPGVLARCGGRRPHPCLREPAGLRIGVYGGSAAEGMPFSQLQSFPNRLQRLLATPDRPVEVLNHGVPGLGSRHHIWRLANTLPVERPSAVVVYTGNNEFWEIIGRKKTLALYNPWLERARVLLWGSALYRLGRRHLVSERDLETCLRTHAEQDCLPSIDPQGAEVTEGDHRFAAWSYRRNLRRIVGVARAHGTPLVLATVATNLLLDDGADPKDPWSSSTDSCLAHLRKMAPSREDAALKALLASCAPHLIGQRASFEVGRILLEAGRRTDARTWFGLAEERSTQGRRSTDALRRVVRDVAEEEGVPLCDLAGRLEPMSERGIPGDDLFVDWCHFNEVGNRKVAAILADCLVEAGIVDRPPGGFQEPPTEPVADPVYSLEAWGGRDTLDMAWASESPLCATRHEPAPALVPTCQGHQAFVLGRFDAAADLYGEALARGGPRAPLLLDRALALWYGGRVLSARETLAEAAAADPTDPEITHWSLITGTREYKSGGGDLQIPPR